VTGFYLGSCPFILFAMNRSKSGLIAGLRCNDDHEGMPFQAAASIGVRICRNRLLSGSRDPGFRWRNILRKNIGEILPGL